MLALVTAFFATALLYASVGFAGGSTYNALLVLAGVDQKIFPIIALACNLIVATGGSIRFARAGLVPWRRLWPLLAVSVPAAWVGGALPVSKTLFILLLGISLFCAGVLLLFQRPLREDGAGEVPRFRIIGPLIAAPLGLLSGIVGIGGGIFLAPVLHLIGWDRTKRISASASVFILANSIAGLGGQLSKITDGGMAVLQPVVAYWPLAMAVLIGGQIGSRAGVTILPPIGVRRLTAVLILYVSIRLLWQSFSS
ncbi:sulfite exporter TauE/SafE family protein [Sphingomonas sp.]|uniref:sulfite exporter TauE/SafE family protein n=1 Tax=Sphingomonas sp. TaxID=28214 RepID=UPI0025E9C0E3|nr:sulfite exporter TauE/SafE family protein [Sphingomonas sp.]